MSRIFRSVYPVFVEAIIIFIILILLNFYEFNSRSLLLSDGNLNKLVVTEILKSSVAISLFFSFTYRLARSGAFMVMGFITRFFQPQSINPLNFHELILDVYITLTFILVTIPIRPILQSALIHEGKLYFENGLVKLDAIPSMVALAFVGIILLFTAGRKYHQSIPGIYIAGIIASVIFVGVLNNQPNFDARLYESRADWYERDWETQGIDAEKALKDAQIDQEKAIAYYWLGVSENRQGRYQNARDHQLRAIALWPEYGASHASLSTAFRMLGDMEKAKYHADKCIEYRPDYAWCYYSLGAYYETLGDLNQTFTNIEKAHQLDPHSQDIDLTYRELKQILNK